MFDNLTLPIKNVLVGILVILVLASIIVQTLKRSKPQMNLAEVSARINTWWVMAFVFAAALLFGKIMSIGLFAFMSALALREYFSMASISKEFQSIKIWVYLAIPIHYYWVYINWYGMFIIFIPVFMFLFLPGRFVLAGQVHGYLRNISVVQWGLMMSTFCLSHVSYLITLSHKTDLTASGPGLVLYLVFLSQFNDVSQFLFGKMFGRHKVSPLVSPKKTYEGLAGGLMVTTLLASLLGPYLTPMNLGYSIGSGVLISLSGFIGDISISAIKRDVGIKDSGSLLPGHGGILDRVDSLYYTAPLFFHYIYYLYY